MKIAEAFIAAMLTTALVVPVAHAKKKNLTGNLSGGAQGGGCVADRGAQRRDRGSSGRRYCAREPTGVDPEGIRRGWIG